MPFRTISQGGSIMRENRVLLNVCDDTFENLSNEQLVVVDCGTDEVGRREH